MRSTPPALVELVADVDAAVPGHLAPVEGLALALLASQLPEEATVVELGCLVGKSTSMLALGLLTGRGGVVYAVDHFAIPAGGMKPTPEARAALHATEANDFKLGDLFAERSQLEVFQDNMVALGLDTVVEPVVSKSAEAAARFEPGSVHMLFVDASHTYEDVRRDLEAWLPRLAPGAIVACHDYQPEHEGVVRATDELLLAPEAVVGPYLVRTLLVGRTPARAAVAPHLGTTAASASPAARSRAA